MTDPHAICSKWVSRLGLGFHPDTGALDYEPPLSPSEVIEYNADMEALFRSAPDPYEYGIKAMAAACLR